MKIVITTSGVNDAWQQDKWIRLTLLGPTVLLRVLKMESDGGPPEETLAELKMSRAEWLRLCKQSILTLEAHE